MDIKATVVGLIESSPAGRSWIQEKRKRRRQQDWTAVHRERFGRTRLSIYTNVGLGDVMITRQLCEEFRRYCELRGDPRAGHIVVSAGAWPLEFSIERGDHNVYWWWSMNGRDNWLDQYLAAADPKPDVVACLSSWCCQYATHLGARTLYLPLAVGAHFRDPGLSRSGIGFAGSKGHKDSQQVADIVGPFLDDPEFTWASGLSTPRQLCEFYAGKKIVLGMTEKFQERAGMVNNRVFEVLATGTPFILHRHRSVEEVLGVAFPYQSSSAEETKALAHEILGNYPKHAAVFAEYRRTVEEKHLYQHRFDALMNFLAGVN